MIPAAWIEADHENGYTYAAQIVGDGKCAVLGEVRVFPKQPNRVPAHTDFLGRSHGKRPRRGGEVVDYGNLPSPGGTTAADVRNIRTDGLLRIARERLSEIQEVPTPMLGYFPELAIPRRDGEQPHRRNDRNVAKVSATYAALVKSGHRAPVKATAAEHGYSVKGVGKILASAREREILTTTTAGKAGGELTLKGERLAVSSAKPNRPLIGCSQDKLKPHHPFD